MATVALKRDGNGGYATADGRWTLTPVVMGEGVNGNGGWSNGDREWLLTDTTGQALIGYGGRAHRTVDTLWRARDIIAEATA